MASREKRPLAPSKSKQKASDDSGLPSPQNNRKRSLPTLRKQQLARDFLEAVAGGSQLSTKLEAAAAAALPSKKVPRSLRHKQKLKNAKAALIKVKVSKIVPISDLHRRQVGASKRLKIKKAKRLARAKLNATKVTAAQRDDNGDSDEEDEDADEVVDDDGNEDVDEAEEDEEEEEKEEEETEEQEEEEENEDEEGVDNEASGKSSKNNLRTKKTKPTQRGTEEADSVPSLDRDSGDAIAAPNPKSSPKTTRKLKTATETPESPSRNAKTSKLAATKRNASKERETSGSSSSSSTVVKLTRNAGKEAAEAIVASAAGKSASSSPETKNRKKSSSANSTVDLTIEEVVSSMVSDHEHEDCQVVGGKITRSRKMLIEEKPSSGEHDKSDKDIDELVNKSLAESEDESSENNTQESQIQLRNRSGNSFGQRSLRNGKLRQLSDSGIAADLEVKKQQQQQQQRRWLNMDESTATESSVGEMSVENASDVNTETEYSFSESSGGVNENAGNMATSKDECSKTIKLEAPSSDLDEAAETTEMENNNNSERMNRAGGDVGPILRSKTKAKSTEMEIKMEEGESTEEQQRPLGRSLASQLEPRKSGSLEQLRKDSLTKVAATDKPPKSRRSSLNIDVKKTMSSFYGNEKPENASKSHIDLMIETIKLGIAKSIESKISRSEKSLAINKNFEIPKIEEIVAPLSADSQKIGLEEMNAEEDNKPNVSKNEAAANSSENSVPKVADTAKEIEKLVMGDIELVDTQRNSESANAEVSRDDQRESSDGNDAGMSRLSEKPETSGGSGDGDEDEEGNDTDETDAAATSEQRDSKKLVVTRKSLRNKTTPENSADLDSSSSGKSINSSAEDGEKTKPEVETPKIEEKMASTSSVVTATKIDAEKGTENEVVVEPLSSSSSSTPPSSFVATAVVQAKDKTAEKAKTAERNETREKTAERSETKDKTAEGNDEAMVDDTADKSEAEECPAEKMEVDANVSEDLETFESISKEVERLVGETTTTNTANKDEAMDTTSDLSEKSTEVTAAKKTGDSVEAPRTSESSAMDTAESDSTAVTENLPEVSKATTASKADAEETTKPHKTNSEDTQPAEITETQSPTKESPERIQEPDTRTEKTTRQQTTEKNNAEEHKTSAEENRRVLRARDKLKKAETKSAVEAKTPSTKTAEHQETTTIKVEAEQNEADEMQDCTTPQVESKVEMAPLPPPLPPQITIKIEEPEQPVRTRRSREVKRRKEEPPTQPPNALKTKRSRRDVRRSDQQNKEETLLDDEVATINENNRSSLVDGKVLLHGGPESLRGFSEGGRAAPVDKLQDSGESNRSKSENDIENVKSKSECSGRLSRERAASDALKENDNADADGRSDSECKIAKNLESSQKDSDDASTSGESSSSSTLNSMIHETPEDKARKESILRLLGLESLEKAAERLNHQKAKKEQYTGTLKTVIRVQKNKDKKRSRSPLKMVLKQGRNDGDGDSPEFYTIQKEFGASGMGDSSSDENNEEAPPKDRQSLVIPEKSASFSIHPGRCCADVCCHCGGKFGSLDTPMHLAQMKSDERRQKILNMEKLLNEDSCICDACYRRVDRKANTSPTNMQTKPHRQLMVLKCSARECREPARHSVKRRWLQRIKARVHNQVDINWESSQHTSIPFCVHHYSKILPFLMCALCKRRLAKNNIHRLAPTETEELNQRLRRQGIPVHLVGGTFVCKHCRYFTQLQLKYKYVQNMNIGLRNFFKDYRIRMLKRYDVAFFDYEEDDALPSTSREENLPGTSKDKDKDKTKKKVKCTQNKGAGPSKSPDPMGNNSASEKSTPEPTPKSSEGGNSETDNENRATTTTTTTTKAITNEVSISREVQLMDLESTVEKLKKRKALEQHVLTSETSITPEIRVSDVVEILAMDKEVTLTRLPKRPRVSSDITPVVQRLGANPSISVRTLFPGEEEMNLHANVEFANVREITPQGWEKCATMIQYDRDTKMLWQELQRPYGNQSSFLRHLILLEKYYRSGDLVLAPNASRNAINYSTSVQNRLISYEGPEKMDEPIMEPISSEFNSSRRLSGGYMMERDRLSLPSASTSLLSSAAAKISNSSGSSTATATATVTAATSGCSAVNANVVNATSQAKPSPPRVLKLNSGVSIIKKPPPSLQRLSLPSGSSTNGGIAKRKEQPGYLNKIPVTSGGKVFQLNENDYKRLQELKRQKQLMSEQKQTSSSPGSGVGGGGNAAAGGVGGGASGGLTTTGSSSSSSTNTPASLKVASLASHYQKAQSAAQTQFQKHLRMQQEMLNRQTRGDFEPLICDVRSLTNENTPTQNLINNLNLPKSIQVTTKPPNPIPILPKIPKSLTVIPQTVARPLDK